MGRVFKSAEQRLDRKIEKAARNAATQAIIRDDKGIAPPHEVHIGKNPFYMGSGERAQDFLSRVAARTLSKLDVLEPKYRMEFDPDASEAASLQNLGGASTLAPGYGRRLTMVLAERKPE